MSLLDGFDLVEEITPERGPDGDIVLYHPHLEAKLQDRPLLPYGDGPFCRFGLISSKERAGIYIIAEDNVPVFVGRTKRTLRAILGNGGIGNISPASCYKGGNQTYVRVNAMITKAVQERAKIEVYFKAEALPDRAYDIRQRIISVMSPKWNIQ
ncbi:hypothetical protein FHS89_001576 [Rubricella aquisinus]|uniref:GIY-YIG domain-containing protein n=1 Tax=Rubricella aquisinus TaxID=2028108 RepID=A0A840WYT8_9RHOB|nr:hypothetical protein [Rubricella aquisinus]MBB5515564.1 hypothetical protein [Rubricella aquisinus]